MVRGPRAGRAAGFLGALAGVLVGTVANDSGSVLLVIGTIYLAVIGRVLLVLGATDRTGKREVDTTAG